MVENILEVFCGVLDKKVWKKGFVEVKDKLKEFLLEVKGEEFLEENWDEVKGYYEKIKKEIICNMVLDEQICLDGCKFDEVCYIWFEIDYLLVVYGFVIFNRGEI